MFSAYAVIGAFVVGALFGVACFALALWLGRTREEFDPEKTVPAEPPPKHRPISGSDFGPGAVKPAPKPVAPAVPHRPIVGG